MSSREHPFNRSTRPLLERKQLQQPQLLLKKKYDYKVRGFNDFNFVSKQCHTDLNQYYSGYPYGSPPSPTSITNTDFIFSDDSGIHNLSNISSTTQGSDDDAPNNTYERIRGCNMVNTWYPPVKHSNTAESRQIQCSVAEQKGPFIFGIDTNTNERYKPVGKNGGSVQRNSMENGKTVIQTKTQQYSNEPIKASSEKSINQNTTTDKRLVKKIRKRNKKDKENRENNSQGIKCVLVGDGAVGKTNLICSYLENRFSREHIPTASDMYNFEVKVNDQPVQVTLCDTAGQDSLDPLRQLSYPDSDIFLLCFSVVKPDSFISIIRKWAPQFSKSYTPILLIGTQADLRTDAVVISKLQAEGLGPVSMTEAWDLATSFGAKYIETSSRFRVGVKDAFDTAIWEALVSLNLPQTQPLWKKLLCLV